MDLIAVAQVVADAWGMHNWSTARVIVMILAMAVVWGLIIGGVIWLIRGFATKVDSSSQSATEILDERLAKGELSVADYEERQAALKGEVDKELDNS